MSELRLDSKRVVFAFWAMGAPWDNSEQVAQGVVNACWDFACDSLKGETPGKMFLLKTAGACVNDPSDLICSQEDWWHNALMNLRNHTKNTEFGFKYLALNLPVCTGWDVAWRLSRWWNMEDSILAYPAMDYVVARLPPDLLQRTHLKEAHEDDLAIMRAAHVPFCQLLEQTAENRGLGLGGYRTKETSPSLLARRYGLAAKDLLEAALRCYVSGVLNDYRPFQNLLGKYPELRVRSETIAIHRNCWEKVREKCSRGEPWESTIHLIVSALLEDCSVSQVDFRLLLEPPKDDPVVVEQLRRAIHSIERLRLFWFPAMLTR